MTTKNVFEGYDTFDIALALYHWLQHNWQGQTDPLYVAFCQLTAPGMYRPARSQECFECLEDNENSCAKEVYELLGENNYRDALSLVLNYESQG